MGDYGWAKSVWLAGACLLWISSAIRAGEASGARPAVEAWRAWLKSHPVPPSERDQPEENRRFLDLGAQLARHTPVQTRELLVEWEACADYLRLAAQIGRRDYWNRVAPTTFRREALVWASDRDPADVVLRRNRALLEDLRTSDEAEKLASMDRELGALETEGRRLDVARKPERFGLYRRACALRRRIALSNPLLDFHRIVFAKRRLAVPNHMCDQYYGRFARPDGGLFVLEDPFGSSPTVRDLLATAMVENGRLQGKALQGGAFLQPALAFDGKSVLFCYSECGLSAADAGAGLAPPDPAWHVEMRERPPWTADTSYHVFRVNLDGRGLVQLTDGAWNDLHPNWLADGRVVFISERRGGFGRCHGRPVPLYTLHAMDADGRNMVRLSHHEGNEWFPSLNNDGMIVYTRWDYVDRGHNQAHHPWITTPDGRNPRAIHGNFKGRHDDNPDMELGVTAIPGSRRYVATACGHHTQAYGSLILIDPSVPDDDAMGPLRRLTPEVGLPETAERGGMVYGTAWPLGERYYLCVYSPSSDQHGVYLLDAFGNRELLYRDPAIGCLGPVPVKPRPAPPIVPAGAEPLPLGKEPAFRAVGDEHPLDAGRPGASRPATVALINVYDSLYPLPEGVRIRSLRIVHLPPKSTPLHHNPQIGYGSETGARVVLGTVPVEDDGSACFYLAPAKAVYFQALDEQGCAVQSMRSATYAQPGERLVCAGCHERKSQAPARAMPVSVMALSRDPSPIRPEPEGSNPLSFPRLVQPVLQKHCVKCHGEQASDAPDLRQGDWRQDKFHWYLSYRNLRPYAFHYGTPRRDDVEHQYDYWQPARTLPGKFGARASRLLAILDKGHYDVSLSREELRRVIVWLDANSDFFGAYHQTEAQSRGAVVEPSLQ